MNTAWIESVDYHLPAEDINLDAFELEDEGLEGDAFDDYFYKELDMLSDEEWEEAFGNGVVIP